MGEKVKTYAVRLDPQVAEFYDQLANSEGIRTSKLFSKILTNDFHMFRAMQIARAQKIPNAYGISCGSTKVYLPNNMFREYFAEIKFLLKQFTKHFQ